jgi:hypothetical protein
MDVMTLDVLCEERQNLNVQFATLESTERALTTLKVFQIYFQISVHHQCKNGTALWIYIMKVLLDPKLN